MKIGASFLKSKNIPNDLEKLNETDVDYIHIDVADGKFVGNKTLPYKEMRYIYRYTSKRLDVHLMVENPSVYIPLYAELNTEFITFHIETTEDIERNLKMIKEYSIKCGLAINHETKVSDLIPYLPYLDMILVMSVTPGYGGQEFIEETHEKLKELRVLLDSYNVKALISVDGGINYDTRKLCDVADMIIAGSYITNSDDFQEKISSLR